MIFTDFVPTKVPNEYRVSLEVLDHGAPPWSSRTREVHVDLEDVYEYAIENDAVAEWLRDRVATVNDDIELSEEICYALAKSGAGKEEYIAANYKGEMMEFAETLAERILENEG